MKRDDYVMMSTDIWSGTDCGGTNVTTIVTHTATTYCFDLIGESYGLPAFDIKTCNFVELQFYKVNACSTAPTTTWYTSYGNHEGFQKCYNVGYTYTSVRMTCTATDPA